MWKYWALLSAVFAALTAILAKVGVRGIDSTLATFIRTIVVVFLTGMLAWFSGHLGHIKQISPINWLFLLLSGLATGLSWLFYFKALQSGDVSKVAPIDKLSVVLVIVFGVLFLHEPLSLKVVLGGALILIGTLVLLQ